MLTRYTCLLRASTAAAAPDVLAKLKRKLRVRYAIESSPKTILSRQDFLAMCSAEGLGCPKEEVMDAAELSTFIDTLHDARVILVMEGAAIHLRPLDVVNDCHAELGCPALQLDPPATTTAVDAAHAKIELHEKLAEPALRSTALFKKRFWSAVALGSGTQMCLLSYLTFVKYDWDVMEPACFFITCVTSIFFYVYLILFRREHSLKAVDENVLPRHLDQALQAASVDVVKWANDAHAKAELERRLGKDSKK